MPVKRVRGDRYFRRRERQAADHRRVLVNEVLGRCLSLLRRHLRLRQQELSYRLDWPQSLLSKVENGEIEIKVEHLGLAQEHQATARGRDHRLGQAEASASTLPTSSRNEPNGPMLDIASPLGPSNFSLPVSIPFIAPYSPRPICCQRSVSAHMA